MVFSQPQERFTYNSVKTFVQTIIDLNLSERLFATEIIIIRNSLLIKRRSKCILCAATSFIMVKLAHHKEL